MQVYAIYKGEKFLDIGTSKELSEKFKVKRETIQFWSTPSHINKMGKNSMCTVKLGKEEE
jgi:hypothetical protein